MAIGDEQIDRTFKNLDQSTEALIAKLPGLNESVLDTLALYEVTVTATFSLRRKAA